MWGVKHDDPEITDLTPIEKVWYFEHWLKDQEDQAELAKHHAYLLASFDHPDAVKQMTDDSSKYSSTDEELEESMRMVKESNSGSSRKRQRRIITAE